MQPLEITGFKGNKVTIRDYLPEKDTVDVKKIMLEIGWLDKDSSENDKHLKAFFGTGRTLLGSINNSVECLAASMDGDMVYIDQPLKLSAVTSVITGMTVRRQGIALNVTSHLLAQDASAGAHVAMLGVFEQGFYDRLGFGAGTYSHRIAFDPSDLRRGPVRQAIRLSLKDAEEMHNSMLKRKRGHCGINIHSPKFTIGELNTFSAKFIGLGYRDKDTGELTHFFSGSTSGENGPLYVEWLVWRDHEQLRELLALISSLGDQIWVADLPEPRDLELQNMVSWPLKQRPLTPRDNRGTTYRAGTRSYCSWELRILDMQECVSRFKSPYDTVKFNLEVDDPLVQMLADTDYTWRGIQPKWTIQLGPKSSAEPGHKARLPLLKTTISAFSRLWMGAAKASALTLTDKFEAPEELITALDANILLRRSNREWTF